MLLNMSMQEFYTCLPDTHTHTHTRTHAHCRASIEGIPASPSLRHQLANQKGLGSGWFLWVRWMLSSSIRLVWVIGRVIGSIKPGAKTKGSFLEQQEEKVKITTSCFRFTWWMVIKQCYACVCVCDVDCLLSLHYFVFR